MQPGIENFIMASDKIMSKLKDFEGIHISIYKNHLHFQLKPAQEDRLFYLNFLLALSNIS
jgi:hypothetical protein